MADYGSSQSPKENHRQPISSFFVSPRFFTGLISKGSNDSELIESSPTSILDSKPFSALKTPFLSDAKTPQTPKPVSKNPLEKMDSRGAGLGLLDVLINEKPDSSDSSKSNSRMVLSGSQLKIQVPPLPPSVLSPAESPKSPVDFGIKTRHSLVGSMSPGVAPSTVRKSPCGSSNSGVFSSLSPSEMELSEDYTCVISYGPNPRTRLIFDDCIVESCCGVVKFSESRKENGFLSNRSTRFPSESLLSLCYNCKKSLGQGNDIDRGAKAFCSSECRCKEIMLEEVGTGTSKSDNICGASS